MQRHRPAVIWLHWFSALLLVAAVALVLVRENLDSREVRLSLMFWHAQAGMTLLLLSSLRLLSRLRSTPTQNEPGLLGLAARLTHLSLYAMLLSIPLLGMATLQAHGKTISVMGLFELPALLDKDRDLAELLGTAHEYLAWTLLAIAGLHIGAALWHQLVRRDELLQRMWPAPRTAQLSKS